MRADGTVACKNNCMISLFICQKMSDANECCSTIMDTIDEIMNPETSPFQKKRLLMCLMKLTRPEVSKQLMVEANRVMSDRQCDCAVHELIKQAISKYANAPNELSRAAAFSKLSELLRKDGCAVFSAAI